MDELFSQFISLAAISVLASLYLFAVVYIAMDHNEEWWGPFVLPLILPVVFLYERWRLLLVIVGFLLMLFTCDRAAYAQNLSEPAYANMQRAVGGIVQQTALSRGLSTADPQTYGTLYGMGKVAVTGAAAAGAGLLAGATSPAWGTVLAVAAVSGAVSYGVSLALDGLVKWTFGSSGVGVSAPGTSSSTPLAITTGQGYWVYGQYIGGDPMSVFYAAQAQDPNGNTYTLSDCVSLGSPPSIFTCSRKDSAGNRLGGATASYQESGAPASCSAGTVFDNSSSACISAAAPSSVATTNLADAASRLDSKTKEQPVNYETMALLINSLWKQAASQQDYTGLPFSVTDPVTGNQVKQWADSHPASYPAVSALVAPVANPSTGLDLTSTAPDTNIDPRYVQYKTATSSGYALIGTQLYNDMKAKGALSTQATTATSTATSTSTDTATGATSTTTSQTTTTTSQDNTVAIGAPMLEGTPTAKMILKPLLNLFPSLREFVVPGHSADCPKPQMTLFNKLLVLDGHCSLLDSVRPTLYAVMVVVWLMLAMFIVLAA